MGRRAEPGTGCSIEAPCKINLHLRVKGRRPDGFHELESVFAALSFGDHLDFELTPEEGTLELLSGGDFGGEIAPEENLLGWAVSLFRERTGFRGGLRARLDKRVPRGAGFGGGSSDAAAALRALDLLAGTGLSRRVLGELAQTLGSDAPFFLEGGTAWAQGRGERLRPLPVPRGLEVVLARPSFPSPTAEAFRLLDQFREGGAREAAPALRFRELPGLLGAHPRDWPFGNDFLPVFLAGGGETAGAYQDILGDFAALGADFSGLSGAGSGCFGIFTDSGAAEKAAERLSGRWNFVRRAFFLARSGRR
jgi:4-diphosphocytidyl-2-C-methyl-D-erythritol kinase